MEYAVPAFLSGVGIGATTVLFCRCKRQRENSRIEAELKNKVNRLEGDKLLLQICVNRLALRQVAIEQKKASTQG